MELPNCLEEFEPELVLTVDDRRKLIKGLAESGTRSIDIFIQDHFSDRRSGIARLVQRLRTRLDHQLRTTREKIERKFKRRQEEIKREDFNRFPSMEFARAETDDWSFKGSLTQEIDANLAAILASDETLNLIINFDEFDEELKLSLWERFKNAVRRFINYLSNLIRRFIAWLKAKLGRGIKEEKEPVPEKHRRMASILLNYPSGKKLWDKIEGKLDNALATSPDVRRLIDKDLKGIGKKTSLHSKRLAINEKSTGRKTDYQSAAREVLNNRIKRALKREEKRLQTELERKKRKLKKLHKDKKYMELLERERKSKLKQAQKQREDELKRINKRYQDQISQAVKTELVGELEDAGYLQKRGNKELKITTRLIDRFAEIVLSDELQKLPGKYSYKTGLVGNPHGIYEKRKLQMAAEASRMDIVDTLVNARLAHPKQRHIYDSDITTHADQHGATSHVVLVFDKSGSMEENERINAAKKAVLALYKAVKHRNQQNIVDFIAFDSYVHVMDLLGAWSCEPSGFTNTSEALSTAFELVKNSRADNKLIYLITDGLPEAYTDPKTSEPRAGDLEKSLDLAVTEARRFKKVMGLKLTIILLEPKEKLYTEAANIIAKAAAGTVIVTDPKDLATEMLTDYIEI